MGGESYIQKDKELKLHLDRQIKFLITSINSFDNGFEDEAIRMATTLRILFHDTTQSTSLLQLLNKKDILFYDTSMDLPLDYITSVNCLTVMGGGKFIAPLDDIPPIFKDRKLKFNEWWNKIIYSDSKHNKFTRRDLVLCLANKEGGAHVDPKLNKAYAELSRLNSLNWHYSKNGVKRPFEGPELASLRQITHEVLKSLAEEFPDKINLKNLPISGLKGQPFFCGYCFVKNGPPSVI